MFQIKAQHRDAVITIAPRKGIYYVTAPPELSTRRLGGGRRLSSGHPRQGGLKSLSVQAGVTRHFLQERRNLLLPQRLRPACPFLVAAGVLFVVVNPVLHDLDELHAISDFSGGSAAFRGLLLMAMVVMTMRPVMMAVLMVVMVMALLFFIVLVVLVHAHSSSFCGLTPGDAVC